MKNKIDFRKGSPGKLLIKMAVPAIIAMVVNGLYYLVDAAFVGLGVGSMGLAGLGLIFPVQMFIIAWGSMLGMGTASVISVKMGENDQKSISSTIKNSIALSSVSSVIFTGICFIFQEPMLNLLGAGGDTMSYAREYIEPLQAGFISVFFSMIGFNIARSIGRAKEAGTGMMIGTLVNLILDPLFIFTFGMGVRGAALATVISRVVSTVYFYIILADTEGSIPGAWRNGKADIPGISRIIVLGLGNFIGQLCFSVIAVIVNKNLLIYGSSIDIAVYGILSRIHVFITMPLLGLSQGFQPVAGFNYGAGEFERVKKVTIISMFSAILIGGVIMLFPVVFPGNCLSLFTDEASLITSGTAPLRTTLLMLPLIGIQILTFSLFQAIGDPVRTIIVSLSRQFIFLIPLLIIFPRIYGAEWNMGCISRRGCCCSVIVGFDAAAYSKKGKFRCKNGERRCNMSTLTAAEPRKRFSISILRLCVQLSFLILMFTGVINMSGWIFGLAAAAAVIAGPVFCGWICPFGFMQETTGKLGSKIRKRLNFRLPELHARLKLLRYAVLGFWIVLTAAVYQNNIIITDSILYAVLCGIIFLNLLEDGSNRDTACISCFQCLDSCPGGKKYLHF